jgi:hypothetical protein
MVAVCSCNPKLKATTCCPALGARLWVPSTYPPRTCCPALILATSPTPPPPPPPRRKCPPHRPLLPKRTCCPARSSWPPPAPNHHRRHHDASALPTAPSSPKRTCCPALILATSCTTAAPSSMKAAAVEHVGSATTSGLPPARACICMHACMRACMRAWPRRWGTWGPPSPAACRLRAHAYACMHACVHACVAEAVGHVGSATTSGLPPARDRVCMRACMRACVRVRAHACVRGVRAWRACVRMLPCRARVRGGAQAEGVFSRGAKPTVPRRRQVRHDGELDQVGKPVVLLDALAAALPEREVPLAVGVEVRHVLHNRHARHLGGWAVGRLRSGVATRPRDHSGPGEACSPQPPRTARGRLGGWGQRSPQGFSIIQAPARHVPHDSHPRHLGSLAVGIG